MRDIAQITQAITALEAQRSLLGDAVVDSAQAALRDQLAGFSRGSNEGIDLGKSLRQVSVLFTDVVESTRLASRLDPEDMHAVLDAALRRFRAIVEAHGGKGLQYAGDSMLAAFGTEAAREDDAERAVRAGRDILDEAQRYSEATRSRLPDVAFAVRVGIHTGPVLIGGGVDSDNMIRGMTVSIAARMEQSAPPGTLRISHATYRLVRGVFSVSEQPPIRVKDHEEPIRSYLVGAAKPRAFRSTSRDFEGIETQMVGRDVELAQLQDAFKSLVSTGTPAFITVTAEAGLGKSRLLHEFQNWTELRPEKFYLFQGRAFAERQRLPYALLRSVFAWRWQIGDDEDMESAKAKLEREMVPLFGADGDDSKSRAQAHILGQMIGLDFVESPHVAGIREDGRQIRNRGFHAASQFFRRLAIRDRMPVVLLLEDLHWADEESLDFLIYLLQVSRDLPLMMVCAARPALLDRRPAWPSSVGAIGIELLPLDQGLSRVLASELLKGLRDIPSALRQLLTARSDGNPFYMEELIKMLVDEGAIDTASHPWRFVPDKLVGISVPNSLVGVLQSRLDKLGVGEKAALQQASAMGVTFWENGLGAIEAESPHRLPAVAHKGLVRSHGQEAAGEQGRAYEFSHQILQRVTYDTVLKPARRLYHARVAAWLAGLNNAWAKEQLGTIAHHYEMAGEADKACEYLAAAAEDANARAANNTAADYARHGLALLEDRAGQANSDLAWRMHVCLERVAATQGPRSEQRKSLDALTGLAEADCNRVRQGYVLARRSDFEMRHSNYSLGLALAEEAMSIATATGDVRTKMLALTRAAANLHYLGRSDEARGLARAGLVEARAVGLKSGQSWCLNVISIASLQGDPLESISAEISCLDLCRDSNDRSGMATALSNIGACLLLMGKLRESRERIQEGLRLSREIGDRETQPYALLNLSAISWREGNDVEAMAFAREALDIALASNSRLKESGAMYWLGNAQMALGDMAGAKASFAMALEIGSQIKHSQRFDAAAGLARIAMLEDDVQGALKLVEPILAHLGAGGNLNGADVPRLIRLTCFEALRRTGDERANEFLAETDRELRQQAQRFEDAKDRDLFLALAEHQAIISNTQPARRPPEG